MKIKINQFKWYELPIKWFMWWFGWTGYTAPTKTIYFTIEPPIWLIRHEMTHVAQMERDGVLKYHAVWLYWFVHGLVNGKGASKAYLDIPYEIEARAAEKRSQV